jgi:outer membrane receptor for ferrienterochelin and colicins
VYYALFCALHLSAATSQPASDESASESIWDILDEQRETSNTIVSATKTEQKLSDTPAVVAVIGAPEIETRGYRSVAEAVRSVTGIVVFDDQIAPDVTVRGINGGLRGWSNTVKVMIDGHPTSFRPDTTNFLGQELIPIQLVERIEVIRGPASALYGANAFLGVINIVTKRAPAQGWSLNYRASGYLNNDRNPGGGGALGFAATSGRVSMNLGLATDYWNASGLTTQQTFPGALIATSANDQKLPKALFFTLSVDAGVGGKFTLDSNLSHFDTFAEFSDWSLATHRNHLSVLNGFGRLRWQKDLLPALSLSAFAAVHSGSVLPNDRIDIGRTDSHFERELSNVEVSGGAEVVWKFRPQDQLSVGVDFATDAQKRVRYIQVLDEDTANAPAGTRTELAPSETLHYTNIGVHTQLIFNPLPWLGTVAGFRFDNNSGYGQGYSPRAGVVVKPLSQLSFKLLYGRSFKAPSGVQLTSRPALSSTDLTGNPALKSQVGDTLELVAASDPTPWLKLQVTGFLMWIQGQITFERFGLNFQARNADAVTSFGVEAEARVTTGRFDAFASFTYARARAQTEIEKVLGQDRRFPTTPEWWLSAGATLRVPEAFLQLYVEARAVGDRTSSKENSRINGQTGYVLAPYAVVDVALSTLELKFAGTQARVMFRVQNLVGSPYSTAGYAGFDAPNLGRTLELVWSHRI